jgi:hypothetical protein
MVQCRKPQATCVCPERQISRSCTFCSWNKKLIGAIVELWSWVDLTESYVDISSLVQEWDVSPSLYPPKEYCTVPIRHGTKRPRWPVCTPWRVFQYLLRQNPTSHLEILRQVHRTTTGTPLFLPTHRETLMLHPTHSGTLLLHTTNSGTPLLHTTHSQECILEWEVL